MIVVDNNINFDVKELKEFLHVEFDKKFLNKLTTDKNIENILLQIFGYDTLKRWLREKPSKKSEKKSSYGQPEDAIKIFNVAGVLDLDPFLLYKVNYINWAKFLKSLDGNIYMAKLINFGKIHKNLSFLDYFFSPTKNFPNSKLLASLNEKKETEKEVNWEHHYFESDLKNNEQEKEQLIYIRPSRTNQVIHLLYKKDKPIKAFEFWQEYKLVFIRPIEDIMYFLETTDIWNNKSEQEKEKLTKEMDVVLVLNIIGGIQFDFINKNEPFLIKTRFMEEKTKFQVSSIHKFYLELIFDNKSNIKTVFEKPC